MGTPFFIFNGIDSTYYLIVNKLPSIFKAQKNIDKIEVEGRDGFLTQDYGTYKSIIKTVECTIKDSSNIDYICSWLDGSGEVIFSNEEDKKYKATIINQIEFSKILRTYRRFIVQFECQPHKYSPYYNNITITEPNTLYNSGALSKPIIKIYGSGDITLTINSKSINLTGITDYITIDSDIQDAYKDTENMNNNMAGEFPVLKSGNNEISWVGTVTKIEITPNWRYL